MRKIFFALAVFAISSLFISRRAYAVPAPWTPGYDIDGEFKEALESDTPNLYQWLEYSFTGILKTVETTLTGSPTGGTSSSSSVGLVGLASYTLGAVYNAPPPVNTAAYLASLNPVRPAYAAGATYLTFVLDVWKIFRNLAYVFLTVILILVGFMLMFRAKIDPRTEITLATSLPKIVIALILITFSYAISGLMIDSGTLLKGLIENIFKGFDVHGWTDTVFPYPFKVTEIMSFLPSALIKMFKGQFGETKIPLPYLPDPKASTLLAVIFSLTLFSVTMRLLLKLIQYYASWFLLAIFSPLLFLLGALPQMGHLIGWWFKRFLVSVFVFPATYFVINLAYYFNILVEQTTLHTSLPAISLFGEFTSPDDLKLLAAIIYFGLLLAAANVPDVIENVMGVEPFAGRRAEAPDLARAAQKIPIIGGLF